MVCQSGLTSLLKHSLFRLRPQVMPSLAELRAFFMRYQSDLGLILPFTHRLRFSGKRVLQVASVDRDLISTRKLVFLESRLDIPSNIGHLPSDS